MAHRLFNPETRHIFYFGYVGYLRPRNLLTECWFLNFYSGPILLPHSISKCMTNTAILLPWICFVVKAPISTLWERSVFLSWETVLALQQRSGKSFDFYLPDRYAYKGSRHTLPGVGFSFSNKHYFLKDSFRFVAPLCKIITPMKINALLRPGT